MPVLGNNKATLLAQVDKQPAIDLQKLVQLINTYEDLKVDDFRGHVSDYLFGQLREAWRNPQELEAWNRIVEAPRNDPQGVQEVQRLITGYIQTFPDSPKLDEAQQMLEQLRREIVGLREKQEWDKLDKGNYSAMAEYKNKYPQSVHLEELEDLMWGQTKIVMTAPNISRYLNDWPNGLHAAEANKAIAGIDEWENIKHYNEEDKIFRVDDFVDNNPASPFIHEAKSLYYRLRDEELKRMKANPSEFSKDYVEKILAANIFSQYELIDEGLMTDASWETLHCDRDLFPNIQDYQVEDPNIQAAPGCTDIYLFGTPGTGKTCLLMGLSGANGAMDELGQSYTINSKLQGGPYASALQEYVQAGITPGRTYGKFVTTINGLVTQAGRRGKMIEHRINLVEMSGEEFALRIADNREVSLSDMGTGATNLLRNDNRKVFFIIVDASKEMVKVDYIEQVKDADGNIVDERIRKKYINQMTILDKFISLFELPENQKIMSKVDAIHFVVTKADTLGAPAERREKARNLLLEKYPGPVQKLKLYCNRTRRINLTTHYRPQVYTFSLGRFYLGDVFDFDKNETMAIIETIREVTGGEKEKTWLDSFKKFLG